MKMLKFTQLLLILELLVAHGTDLCCADIQNSEADFESDDELFPEFSQDPRSRHGEQLEWSQPPENVRSGTAILRKVAFYVGLSKNIGPVSHVLDIVFDNSVTNIGSGYSTRTGRFKAPVTGTYQFSISVAAQPTKSAAVTMVKNGLTVMTLWSEARPNWAPSFNVAILSLNAGDQVWLQVSSHNYLPSYLYGRMYTTFSGFLIFKN